MILTGRIAKDGFAALARQAGIKDGRHSPHSLILVADRGLGRLFQKIDGQMVLVGEAFPDVHERALYHNSGRVLGSAGTHHRYDLHLEQSRKEEMDFAKDLADWLHRAHIAGAYDRLIVVAGPQMLGDLRAVIDKDVQARVVASVDKDLTNLGEREVLDALDDLVWISEARA